MLEPARVIRSANRTAGTLFLIAAVILMVIAVISEGQTFVVATMIAAMNLGLGLYVLRRK